MAILDGTGEGMDYLNEDVYFEITRESEQGIYFRLLKWAENSSKTEKDVK